MALCDSSVLTGQEGSITFKPPGTSVCVRDFSAWGTDGTTSHITLPCDADLRVGDVVNLFEEDGGNLDGSFTASTFSLPDEGVEGAVETFGSHVAGSGYTSGSHIVDLIGGSGTGARARVTIAGGEVTGAQLLSAGSGYHHSDQLTFNLPGGGSGFAIEVGAVSSADAVPFALTDYYVVGTGTDSDGHPWIQLSATENGAAITVAGDGGTGTADNDLPAHINIKLSEWFAVCGVREFSLDISRDELDVTTLPCGDGGTGCDTLAAFRSTQAGYASATGSMSVYFTCDQDNIANRLLSASLLKSQSGASVRLYVCTQYDSGEIDNDTSLYIEAEISITGMSFSVNPDDPTTGELSFSVTKMISAFGTDA